MAVDVLVLVATVEIELASESLVGRSCLENLDHYHPHVSELNHLTKLQETVR